MKRRSLIAATSGLTAGAALPLLTPSPALAAPASLTYDTYGGWLEQRPEHGTFGRL